MDEYVGMLVAAGWIDAGDIDDEYQQYIKRVQKAGGDEMTYQGWKSDMDEWKALDAQFKQLEEKHGIGTVWDAAPEETKRLCDAMAEIEWRFCW